MRGHEKKQSSMLCLISPADRVPADHPLREIKALVDEVLRQLSHAFDAMYAAEGRPSIPPESLLKASLLIALYSIRSERQFCDQLDYNLLFRWFLDMDMLDPTFDHSTFSKNRERLLAHDVAGQFFRLVVEAARAADLLSRDHFTVDGTLIEAWASLKSFRPKDRKEPPTTGGGSGDSMVDFRGEKRSNDTHESTTDPEAKLIRKGFGKEAKLSFGAHALMENRNGLLVDFRVSDALTRNERDVGLAMLADAETGPRPTIGGDRGYNSRAFVDGYRERGFVPHVAQKKDYNAIDGRTTRHTGYAVSQRLRKRVEEIFGWMKTVAGFRKTRYKGRARTQLAAYFVGAAYNLLRIAKLMAAPA
jgi:transposase